jgi:hypothetical protein
MHLKKGSVDVGCEKQTCAMQEPMAAMGSQKGTFERFNRSPRRHVQARTAAR